MKWMDFFYRIVHTKISYLMLLVLVWSIVGFVIGLAMGRIFWMLQLL